MTFQENMKAFVHEGTQDSAVVTKGVIISDVLLQYSHLTCKEKICIGFQDTATLNISTGEFYEGYISNGKKKENALLIF